MYGAIIVWLSYEIVLGLYLFIKHVIKHFPNVLVTFMPLKRKIVMYILVIVPKRRNNLTMYLLNKSKCFSPFKFPSIERMVSSNSHSNIQLLRLLIVNCINLVKILSWAGPWIRTINSLAAQKIASPENITIVVKYSFALQISINLCQNSSRFLKSLLW